jgi:hypothetical protein
MKVPAKTRKEFQSVVNVFMIVDRPISIHLTIQEETPTGVKPNSTSSNMKRFLQYEYQPSKRELAVRLPIQRSKRSNRVQNLESVRESIGPRKASNHALTRTRASRVV